jgi:hypothetical protein
MLGVSESWRYARVMMQDRAMRRWQALGSLLIVSVIGVPYYFFAFLFAYGFEDSVGVGSHATFLILVGVFAVVAGRVSLGAPLTHPPHPPRRQRLAFGVLASVS